MDSFHRSTETQIQLLAVNPKKIEPEVNCAAKSVINKGFSSTSGNELNQQSFLRLMAKVIDEKKLKILDKERLVNELSLLQSQLTDSNSKLQMFQNVKDELEITKSELEKNKSVITDITEINLRLTNDNSLLRRKIKDRDGQLSAVNPEKIELEILCVTGPVINDGISTTSRDNLNQQSFLSLMGKMMDEKKLLLLEKERLANELSLLRSQLTDSNSKLQMFQNVKDELAITKSELEKNKSVITDITEINLRLTNDNSLLRRKIKDRDGQLSAVNPEKIELEILCVTGPVINDGISTTSRDNLNQQSFLSLMGKMMDEKKLLLFEKERLANELSLLRSQLTDSNSKLQMFQNVKDELAITKSELEKNKSVITDITEIIIRLTNDDSLLRRKIKDRDGQLSAVNPEKTELEVLCVTEPVINDGISTTSRDDLNQKSFFSLMGKIMDEKKLILLEKERLTNELSLLRSQLTDSNSKLQMFQNVNDELAITKKELEKNKSVISDITEINFCWFKSSPLVVENPSFITGPVTQRTSGSIFSGLTAESCPSLSFMFRLKSLPQYLQEEPVSPPNLKKSDFFEKNDNQSRHIPENQHALPLNPEKSNLLEKKDIQLRHQPQEPHVFPPNLEKSDIFEKKDNQPQLLQEDPYVFPVNNLNIAEFVSSQHPPHAMESKDVLRYIETEEVGMIYLKDENYQNNLYPWSLLQELEQNQRSKIKPWNQLRFPESFNSDKPDLVEGLETDNQSRHKQRDPQVLHHYPNKLPLNSIKSNLLEKKDSQIRHQPEEHHVLPQNLEKSDFFEKKDQQRQLLQEHPNVFPPNSFNTEANHPRNVTEDPHALPPNPEKSYLFEKKDNQSQHKPEDLQHALPPNPEKSDLLEKKDNQSQRKPEDLQHALPPNPKKSDLLEKKDNQPQHLPEDSEVLPHNLEQSDLLVKKDYQPRLKPEDLHALPQNPEKSDFFKKKDNQPGHKPEDTHALQNQYKFGLLENTDNQPRHKPEDAQVLSQNPEKSDLLEKKDNQAQLILEDLQNTPTFDEIQLVSSNMPPNAPKSDLVFNQPQHPPEKPQPLLLNPENPDLVFQKDNQPRDKKGEERPTELPKPESQQKQTVSGNTKVEQEDRKQVELEKNPTVEKCVINGKTFPLMNEWGYDYKFAAVHYNVWKRELKVEIVINHKKSIIPILVINNPLSKDKDKAVYIIN
ncbi:uncharacterized protein LOC124205414 [Daphnia pulex]|uniref:uncharacterized protein LOC124205414 n=1 Tax=Daphnia pulex TaxID=6669 RepID=UPI001EDFCF5A|nr:uncharacterized protein LOC124205414 [Daphnia pulex]